MGFISSATTVSVEAKLTDAGKRKLYESIENNSSGFVSKFTIGDSDTNYAAVDAGAGPLDTGHVPEASDFKPEIRSFALYEGVYRPGIPVILVNDTYGSDNGVTASMSIGVNEQIQMPFTLKTEWPKNENFDEFYSVVISEPTSLAGLTFQSLFMVVSSPMTGNIFQFNGGATAQELINLLGADHLGSSTIPIKIIGRTTHAQVVFNIEIIQ